MEVVYSKHALEKIQNRKLIKVWIKETIKWPNLIQRSGKKYYSYKKLNGYTLKVVYVKEKYIKVITCYFVK